MDATYEPKALYYYAKRFFSKLLIVVVPELDKVKADLTPVLQPLNVIVINDSNQPITTTLNCRLIDLFGSVLDQVAFPIAIGSFSTLALLKLPKAIVAPTHPDKSALHLMMEKDGRKIAENLFLYLPDKYIDWPNVEITRRFSQITEKKWKLKLRSNALAKDVHISTAVPAQFSDNFIDLVPHDESEIIIDCEQQVPSLESALQLCSVKSAF
jgi:beta-galactosidase/beta-glucuronidase